MYRLATKRTAKKTSQRKCEREFFRTQTAMRVVRFFGMVSKGVGVLIKIVRDKLHYYLDSPFPITNYE